MTRLLPLLTVILFACCRTGYIYVARHAEKSDSTITSGLSPAGQYRALALRDSLIRKSIDVIYTSDIKGAQETARPLAETLHIPLTIYKYSSIDSLVKACKANKHKNILIINHRGTMPLLIEKLTEIKIETPAIFKYDYLFIVRFSKGKYQMIQSRYGVISHNDR